MNSRRLLACIAFAIAPLAAAVSPGCSSKTNTEHVTAPCSQDECLQDNVCAGEPAVCMLRCNLHSDCPDGYACRPAVAQDGDGGSVQVCEQQEAPVSTGGGGYLTSCATGLEADCAQGYVCNGAKAQQDAVCTQLGACQSDADCPASQWCGELHRRACESITADRVCASDGNCTKFGAGYKCFDAIFYGSQLLANGFCEKTCAADGDCGDGERCGPIPGVPDRKRCWHDQPNDWCDKQPDSCGKGWSCHDKVGAAGLFDAAKTCVNRTFCSPCANDADCGSLGSACIQGTDGTSFCASPCSPSSPSTCPPEAECKQAGGDYKCVPRAGACSASPPASCSPCRNDGDCGPGGVCDVNASTGERACALPCDANGKCAQAPGGKPMVCCNDSARCGAEYMRCIANSYRDVPDPRYQSGCWLQNCATDADCNADLKEICFPRAQVCVSAKSCSKDDDCSIYTGEGCDKKLGLCRPKSCTKTADCPPCSILSGCGAGDQAQFATCDTKYGACLPPQ